MREFNNGKPYHGSDAARHGRLQGANDTDYFYFFCPKCPDRQVMRVLEHGIHAQAPENKYNDRFRLKAKGAFTIVFKLHCEKCQHTDFVKVSNTGWQGGKYDEARGQIVA